MYTYMYTDLHVPQLFDFHSLVRVHVDGLEELLHRGARGVLQDLLGRDEAAGVGVDLPEEPPRLPRGGQRTATSFAPSTPGSISTII